MGRLTTAQYNLCVAPANPTSFAEVYSYHPAGAVLAKRLAVTRTEYSSSGYPAATPTANLDVTYTYTPAGLVRTVAYPTYASYNGNTLVPTTFTYGYDAMSRPVSLQDDGTQGANPAVTWVRSGQYDFAGRLASWQHYALNWYQNIATSYVLETESYNVNGQLSGVVWSVPYGGSDILWRRLGSSICTRGGRITGRSRRWCTR